VKNYINIKDLSFAYRDGQKALSNINFDLHEGETVAIMGRSGAGKSTLCRCLNGIIPGFQKGRLSGDIHILGESTRIKKIYELAKDVGLVFQDFEYQLFSTSVELEVAFGPENLALSREEIAIRIKHALETVGLKGFENRQPYALSGGEKQRLAIASVISSRPKILVLDEPATDLDPQGRHDIFSALKELKNEFISLLIIEHEVEDIIDSDRIAIIDDGDIVASGRTHDMLCDINLLEKHGIRPSQVAKLFSEKSLISNYDLPLTAEEAYKKYAALFPSNLKIDDEGNKNGYGNVIIEVNKLRHSYPEVGDVLNEVDLEIREGEFIAIIGQNGSGKTTLAKHFNGLLKPSSGKVICNGKDTGSMRISDLGKIVGYVFQNPDHQIFASSVREELTFGPKNYGLSYDDISKNITQSLEAVHLEGYEDRDPFTLTKGERQRVAVASVLACKPKVLVLDEPTTGLDYHQQKSMMELLKSLNSSGHTVIIITHSLWVAAEYAHRIIVMHKGNVVMDGPTREVFSRCDELDHTGIRLPEIIKLSNMLGNNLLSVDEYKYLLQKFCR